MATSQVVPKILHIETVANACTARCTMCPIETWTRPRAVMKLDFFAGILDKMLPYRDSLEVTVLHGCGEPLLDKTLPQKIALARKLGFPEVHFATNGTELDEKRSQKILDSGLHTLIFSFDGITKETHEAIRVGTNFEEITDNARRFISMRDAGDYDTKIWIRMIRQPSNEQEWPAYQAYWSKLLTASKGDKVVFFPIHNWADRNLSPHKPGKPTWCQDLNHRVYIHCSGSIALCCADDNGWHEIGNVSESDPVELLKNSPVFQRHRDLMASGRINELEHCRTCTLPLARAQKSY